MAGVMVKLQHCHIRVILLLLAMFRTCNARSEILFHCDNMGIAHVLNKQTSKDKRIMVLLIPLILLLLQHNIRFRATHISTHENTFANAISHFQVAPLFLQEHVMQLRPAEIPCHLEPQNYIPS